MIKIFMIDDSKAVHALVQDMLAIDMLHLDHAYDGRQGLDTASQDGFAADLILLDWEMPVLNGIEALPLIKAKRPTTPILMMTSKNAMSDIIQALEKGATDYIIKPFTKDILVGKISQVLGREVG